MHVGPPPPMPLLPWVHVRLFLRQVVRDVPNRPHASPASGPHQSAPEAFGRADRLPGAIRRRYAAIVPTSVAEHAT
jgi:hypothetical protein